MQTTHAPKGLLLFGHIYDQRPAKKLAQQTEAYRKTAYLRERSPCPRTGEICRFRLENKSKTLLHFKNNLKPSILLKKFTIRAIFRSK